MLLFTKDTFIQCIEGEKDEVNALYDTIRKDERHSNITLNPYVYTYISEIQSGENT